MRSVSFFKRLSDCTNEYLVTDSLAVITFALCIPLYEFLIYPFLRNYVPRTKIRIGLGFVVALFGMSALLSLDVVGHNYSERENKTACLFYKSVLAEKISPHHLLLIPVIMLMALGEMLMFLSTLEFIVAQSPYSMRGLILGLFFMFYGIAVGFGSAILTIFGLIFEHIDHHSSQPSCGTSYIMAVVLIGFIGGLLYAIVTRYYKDRQRGGQVDINHQTVLEGYYES